MPQIPKNNLITLKPVAGSLKNFTTQLRETKIPLKNTPTKPSSYLKNNTKSMSVTDLRKSFEKFGNAPPPLPQNNIPKEPKARSVKSELKKLESTLEKKPKTNGEVVKLETVKVCIVVIA